MLIHHQTIVIRVNNVIKIIIRTNNSFSQKLRKYIPEAPVVGIDFRKFLRVACVETLLVVPLDCDKSDQNKNGFFGEFTILHDPRRRKYPGRFWAKFSSQWVQESQHRRMAASPWLHDGARGSSQLAGRGSSTRVVLFRIGVNRANFGELDIGLSWRSPKVKRKGQIGGEVEREPSELLWLFALFKLRSSLV